MALAAPHAGAQTNAIQDGSFEQGFGSPQVWHGGVNASQLFVLPTGYYNGSVAESGSYFLAIQGHGEIYQDVSGLTPGQRYTLSFFLSPWTRYYEDTPGHIAYPTQLQTGSTIEWSVYDPFATSGPMYLEASTPYTVTPYDSNAPGTEYAQWYRQTVDFTASSSTLRVDFLDPDPTYYGNAGSQGNNPAIDNVSLSATTTPEPGTLLLLVPGIGALGLFMRRRRPG